MRCPVGVEEFQRLSVGKVTPTTTDALFEEVWVSATIQHLLIVVGFQESGVAKLEVFGEFSAYRTQIGEYANVCVSAGNHKAMRFDGVVYFRESRYQESADLCFAVAAQVSNQRRIKIKPAVAQGPGSDVNRQLVFLGQATNPFDMIGMLMGNEKRLNLLHGEVKAQHAFLYFTT